MAQTQAKSLPLITGDRNATASNINSMFPLAAQPDIVRSWQKDEYYLHVLNLQTREVAQILLGQRQFAKYESEIKTFCDVLYFGVTTCVNQPTLGEEYCDLVQITQANTIPNAWHRCLLVSFRTIFPYVIDKMIHYASKQVSSGNY